MNKCCFWSNRFSRFLEPQINPEHLFTRGECGTQRTAGSNNPFESLSALWKKKKAQFMFNPAPGRKHVPSSSKMDIMKNGPVVLLGTSLLPVIFTVFPAATNLETCVVTHGGRGLHRKIDNGSKWEPLELRKRRKRQPRRLQGGLLSAALLMAEQVQAPPHCSWPLCLCLALFSSSSSLFS